MVKPAAASGAGLSGSMQEQSVQLLLKQEVF